MRLLCSLVAIATVSLAEQPVAVKLLEKKCLACHNGPSKKSGLDLSSREMAIRGGDRGPAIVPGNANESFLFKVVTHAAPPHMPFQGQKLSQEETTAIAHWLDKGAAWELPVEVSKSPKSDHWAFRTPARPSIPAIRNKAWVRNPIDVFIAAEHEKRNLAPMPEAGKRTLLRRIYLDLIGLPPTVPEIAGFLADKSPRAYEEVVDHLLADPRYGERWGRHWMDVWRYSDWYGRRGKVEEVRNSHNFMWRWRDWIVESLNKDKPYDKMVLEMVAADEIAPNDPDALRATGFLARSYSKFDRNGWMENATDHTAMGFLGVTVKCARCHDHKYDAISQEDYYRFRAFFEPYEVRIDRVPGQLDIKADGLTRVFDADLNRPTYLLIRGDVQSPDKDLQIAPAVPPVLGGVLGKIEPVSLPTEAYYPDYRSFASADLIAEAKAAIEKAEAEVRKAENLALAEKTLAAAKAQLPALEARMAADRAKYSDPPDPQYEQLAIAAAKVERVAGILKADEALHRAQLELTAALAAKPADEKKVAAATQRLTEAQTSLTRPQYGYSPIGPVYPTQSSGRRTALARWLVSKENPLTARVAVNHLWLRHFGSALVPTVFEFGKNGKTPTHPELLDWLANEFMDRGWSMKAIHRLIVTSSAYRMRSTAGSVDHKNATVDPDNQYLWRMNPRRMEAEAVRDSILHIAGRLDTTMGGPEIDEAKGAESHRRSIYFRHSPDTQMQFLKTFDTPNPAECYMRSESVVPQQALALANSKLSLENAQVVAQHLESETATPLFVKSAFEAVLGRPPSKEELSTAARFLEKQSALLVSLKVSNNIGGRARANLVHVLFNHNDFVTIR